MMRYIAVEWIHDDPEDPVWIYNEIGEDNYEVRRVDQFRGGSFQWMDATHENDTDFLSYVPIPSLDEINADPEFCGVEISKERFEEIWAQATGGALL